MPVRTIRTISISILALGLLAGTAAGVAAQDELDELTAHFGTTDPMGATILTLELGDAAEFTEDEATGIITTTGRPVEATDVRATGSLTLVDDYGVAASGPEEDSGIDVISTAAVLENEEGSWVGTGRAVGAATPDSERFGSELWELQGRGGYAGLTLFVVRRSDGQRWGIIMPNEEVKQHPALPAE